MAHANQMMLPEVAGQAERLVNYLIEHAYIDPMTAWTELGIYRVAAVVYRLKRRGYNITTSIRRCRNRWGEAVDVTMYKLEAS